MIQALISVGQIKDAQERMLSMDEYLYLIFGIQGVELDLKVNMAKLIRLGYVDKDFSFTDSCLDLVPDIESSRVLKFEEFWNMYPLNDAYFNYPKSRTLRVNKAVTRKEYEKAANTHGEDFILEALRTEVEDRMTSSSKKNAFTYMKSSVNYLKSNQFLEYA